MPSELPALTPLPIDPFVPRVVEALRDGRDVVLVAEPGAGKTTRLPPAIVRSGLLSPRAPEVTMLQPRRVAARAAAGRIAEEQAWRIGGEVGYQVRFERMLSRETRLRVVTEGILVRQLVGDPELGGIGCVVLDEFHERNIHSDLALAMLREAKAALRPDLRLVVMSATLDADAVAAFLGEVGEVGGVETLHVPGRLFPVEVAYAGDKPVPVEEQVRGALEDYLDGAAARRAPGELGPSEEGTDLSDTHERASGSGGGANGPPMGDDGRAAGRSPAARRAAAGDVLVFLPGVREIERTMTAIDRLCARHGYAVLPLHGSLTKEEQDRAVDYDPAAPPRVICATNIAETSLTLPGVRLVIDSGLVRQAGYDAGRGVETLETIRISKASAEQRAGRSGRVAEGRCVRLWSKMTHRRLPDFDIPEIRRVDLCEASLAVRAWGGDPTSFGWYERPDAQLLASAEGLLTMIGAVEAGRLTPLGKRLEQLPLHPRPARLITGAPAHLQRQAALVAALLGEGADVPGRRTANIHELLDAYDRRRLDPVIARTVTRAAEQLSRTAERSVAPGGGFDQPVDTLEQLLLLAYPDRVCRRRSADTATLVNGGGVRLPDPAALRRDWFLALGVRRGTVAQKQQADVRLLAELEVEWLAEHFPSQVVTENVAQWDETRQRAVAVRRVRYHDLVIDEQRGGKLEPGPAEALVREHLDSNVGLALIDADETLGPLYQRAGFLFTLSDRPIEAIRLPPKDELLRQACEGAASAADVISNARVLASNALLADREKLIDRWAPQTVEVPTGSRVRLDWSEAYVIPEDGSGEGEVRAPVLAVRLQELFGLPDTPRVGPPPGVPVTLHLLGPNFRPVQVTNDLASFWKNTYPQVRKDLRARYPKHSWPEDPLAADPVRGARRRR